MSVIGHACRACGQRWAQEAGLCRRCGRETGVYRKSTRQADADRVARMLAVRPVLARREPESGTAVLYSRQIDGHTYDVVWDGSR